MHLLHWCTNMQTTEFDIKLKYDMGKTIDEEYGSHTP